MSLFFEPKNVTDRVANTYQPSDWPIVKPVFRYLINGIRYHSVNDSNEEIGNQTVTVNVIL